MNIRVTGKTKLEKLKAVVKRYCEILKESFGLILVGIILFPLLNHLAEGVSEHAKAVQNELAAHRAVFLALNSQVVGLALAFCGIFFMTAGSENSRFFAKYFCVPFITFIRDGAVIALGGFLSVEMGILWIEKNLINSGWEPIGTWGGCVLCASAVLCTFEIVQAKDPHEIKFNWGAIFSGFASAVTGIYFIFKYH